MTGQVNPGSDHILSAIQKNDTSVLSGFLLDHDVDAPYGAEGHTLLAWAVLMNKSASVSFLLKNNANPNEQCHNHVPIHLAARAGLRKPLEILLASGANPNITDSAGNTALIMGAGQKKISIVKTLIKYGAWVNFRNKYQLSAVSIAVLSGNMHIANYLKTYYELNLPSWTDGPYVNWTSRHRIRISYAIHDSLTRTTSKLEARYKVDSLPFCFRGLGNDTGTYWIHRNFKPAPVVYNNIEKLMVLGDVHGDYDDFSAFLSAQSIIDSEMNWNWGDGHLVILGDLFDRGEKVTECLWLVHKLQYQASLTGGQVHVILGNHELMELKGDHRYLNEKYLYLNDRLRRNYSDNFKNSTELGRWIRSFNTMEIIDSILFVHAGLHPYTAESGLNPSQINTIVREVMVHKNDRQLPPVYHWTVSESGPLWYRGYFNKFLAENALEEEKVVSILKHFDVQKMVIGHTNVKDITSLYHGKVIAIDIPYYLGEGKPKGLLVCGRKLCIALMDGSIVPFTSGFQDDEP
ncbi:MAG: metallophosphoesterase [Bacteroidales bacterium]